MLLLSSLFDPRGDGSRFKMSEKHREAREQAFSTTDSGREPPLPRASAAEDELRCRVRGVWALVGGPRGGTPVGKGGCTPRPQPRPPGVGCTGRLVGSVAGGPPSSLGWASGVAGVACSQHWQSSSLESPEDAPLMSPGRLHRQLAV